MNSKIRYVVQSLFESETKEEGDLENRGTIKLLRIKILQPSAHFRIPYMLIRRHTYPLPPFSTVIGLLCNIMGIKSHEDKNFLRIKNDLEIGIYSNFETVTVEYILFRNLSKDAHIKKFESETNRMIEGMPEHPGQQIPIKVDVLENVKIIIYIKSSVENLNFIKESFFNPVNRLYPLHLGRAEDLIIFPEEPEEAIKIIEIENKVKEFIGALNYFTWLPYYKSSESESDFYYIPMYGSSEALRENYVEFFDKVRGSIHFIGTYYKVVKKYRLFQNIKVKLFEKGGFPLRAGRPFKFYIDDELNIPLFLTKVRYPEVRNDKDFG